MRECTGRIMWIYICMYIFDHYYTLEEEEEEEEAETRVVSM